MKYSLRFGIVLVIIMLCPVVILAQDGDDVSDAFVTNSFKDNVYGRIGVDMSLQNPYGCNFANAFSPMVSPMVSISLSGSCLHQRWEAGLN